eukprot:gi/632964692/ref/XP_007898520.1/ PREDICTED: uncharacterized protein C9orf117 homolog [Callorhinchus milii]
MAPKKKKDRAAPPGDTEAKKSEPLSELDKEFYLIQIRDQESRVAKYQRRLDELEVQKNESEDSLTRLSKEMEDIISFLKKCLDQRADEIADLNDKLVALDQAKEVEKDAYETQLSHLRHECQDAKDQLTTENIALAGKLAAVEEFRLQKEQLMANFATLEEELKKMDHDHKGTIYDLERRAVIDKDRLKKEMISRLNTVATEFRRVSKTQMSQTTKRTIRENVSISIQLGKMSDKSLQLIKQNDEMRKATMTQWTHLHIMEENERKLIKKNSSNRKIISMLTEKCKEQQVLLNKYKTEEEEYQKQKIMVKELQEQNESLSIALSYVDEELKKTQLDLKNKLTLLAEESERRKRVEEVLSDAAYALKDILLSDDELPETRKLPSAIIEEPIDAIEQPTTITEQPTTITEQPVTDTVIDTTADTTTETPMDGPVTEKSDSKTSVHVQRSQMMHKLLLVLNTAACIGLGPPLGEFTKQEKASVMNKLENISKRSVQICQDIRGPGIQPHYRQGDLGLVPRAKHLMPNIYDKVGFLSRTTRLGLIRTLPKLNCSMYKGSQVSEQGGKLLSLKPA